MARPGVLQHRKFLRLVHDLGIPEPHALGHLEVLWHRCYESTDDLLGDRVDVELAAGWVGEPGKMAEGLIRTGWVDESDDGVCRVHDLWDHAPDYVGKRWKREQERRARGKTISDFRRAAGRLGGIAAAEKAAEERRQEEATAQQVDGKRPPLAAGCPASGEQTAANGRTPAPAPAPDSEEEIKCELGSAEPTAPSLVGDDQPPPTPPARQPEWLQKAKPPKGVTRAEIGDCVLAIIEAITGRRPDLARCKTEAAPILATWRARGEPPLAEFRAEAMAIARAARECGSPLFARDVRAEGWENGVDRSRSVPTLMRQNRWAERLEVASSWLAQVRKHDEFAQPHSPRRHGMGHPNGRLTWCSRAGRFVSAEEWSPLAPAERDQLAQATEAVQ